MVSVAVASQAIDTAMPGRPHAMFRRFWMSYKVCVFERNVAFRHSDVILVKDLRL